MLPAWATVALSLGVALIASGGTFGATLLQLSRAEKERLDRERSRRIERTATVVGALNSLLSDAAPRRVANSDDERPDEALRAAWRPLRADLMTLGAILYEPGVGEIIGGMIAEVDPQIRAARKSDQEAIVAQLLADNEGLAERWNSYRRYLLVLAKRFFRKSGRYQLFAPGNLGKGDQNIYRMFIETALRMTAPNGYAAQVLPSNLYNGANAAAIRRELLENWDLQWVLGFINENEHWFKGIHTDTKFAIYSARKRAPRSDLHIGFRIQSDQELHTAIERRRTIDRDTIRQEGPDTLAIPETADSGLDVVASKMLAAWPKFGEEIDGLPYRHYQREVDMGTDRDLFVDGLTEDGLPVFEGRMVDQYDYRAKAYVSGRGRAARWDDLPFGSPEKAIVPQWRVPRDKIPAKLGDRTNQYRVAWNDVASPEYGRSLKAALIPPAVIGGDTVPNLVFDDGFEWLYMPYLAAANSLCFDALTRRLVSLHLKYYIMDALPFPRWPAENELSRELGVRALRLSCTGPEMAASCSRPSASACRPRTPARATSARPSAGRWTWRASASPPRSRSRGRR